MKIPTKKYPPPKKKKKVGSWVYFWHLYTFKIHSFQAVRISITLILFLVYYWNIIQKSIHLQSNINIIVFVYWCVFVPFNSFFPLRSHTLILWPPEDYIDWYSSITKGIFLLYSLRGEEIYFNIKIKQSDIAIFNAAGFKKMMIVIIIIFTPWRVFQH